MPHVVPAIPVRGHNLDATTSLIETHLLGASLLPLSCFPLTSSSSGPFSQLQAPTPLLSPPCLSQGLTEEALSGLGVQGPDCPVRLCDPSKPLLSLVLMKWAFGQTSFSQVWFVSPVEARMAGTGHGQAFWSSFIVICFTCDVLIYRHVIFWT